MKKHDVRHCWCLGFSPWTFHPVFHGVKTTQHLGKIPGVPCNVCTVQFPGTATSRPALPGAGPMCLRCLAEFWITGKIREVLWNYFGIATEIPRCSKWFLVITTWEAISFGNYLESLGITMELVCFIPIYPPKKQKQTQTYPNCGITILPMYGVFGDGLWQWVYHITTNVFQHISTISWWLVFKHICIYAGKAMINHPPPNHHKLVV